MTASGRELVAMNGCFGDVEPIRSRPERRSALESSEGALRVACRCLRPDVDRPLCVAHRTFAAVRRVCAV